MKFGRLRTLYRDLVYYSYRQNKFDLYLADQPFRNLLSEIIKEPYIGQYFDLDLATLGIINALKNLRDIPEKIEDAHVNEMLSTVKKFLEINLAEHYIVVAVPELKLRERIDFDRFVMLPNLLEREQKIKLLSEIIGLDYESFITHAEHTEKSRDEDFFQYTLMCIKLTQQTERVWNSAARIAEWCIYALRAIHYGYSGNINEPQYKIVSSTSKNFSLSRHVAVYSQEHWRMSHESINPQMLICEFDADWLSQQEFQKKYSALTNLLIFPEINARLDREFLNALIIFNRAIERKQKEDYSIAVLLLMTAAEIILTQNKDGKKKRLATILPHIAKIEDCSESDMSSLIDIFYAKRSDFVHAGISPLIEYGANEYKKDFQRIFKIIARVISEYPRYVKDIDLSLQADGKALSEITSTDRFDKWNDMIENIWDLYNPSKSIVQTNC